MKNKNHSTMTPEQINAQRAILFAELEGFSNFAAALRQYAAINFSTSPEVSDMLSRASRAS